MIPDRRFKPEPMTADEAIAWLQTHRYIWYQAPMDHSPVKLWMKPAAKLKLWKRNPERFSVSMEIVTGWAPETLRLNNDHLDRLRMPFDLWHHSITATVSHVDYVGSPHNIVLHQSNGFHLNMSSLSHAINFAKRKAMELKVHAHYKGKLRTRILVPAHPPISGEQTFQ